MKKELREWKAYMRKKGNSTKNLKGERKVINGEKILILPPISSGIGLHKVQRSNRAKTLVTKQNLKKKK